MDENSLMYRNYTSISPSAKSLLLTKGVTSIPYARKAAELISYPGKYNPDIHKKDVGFWARVLHFENRYRSIDQLINKLPIKNVLELSSGFSFRGLVTARQPGVHYIDTDLPEVVAIKKDLIAAFQQDEGTWEGTLETLPLNALDENRFAEITAHFSPGEIIIVNEGLLMYLKDEEKATLCNIIRKTLEQRGGYWITADIYIRHKMEHPWIKELNQQFFKKHHIEENKFESFEAAKRFFNTQGFALDKEAVADRPALSSIPFIGKDAPSGLLFKTRTTWQLKVANT